MFTLFLYITLPLVVCRAATNPVFIVYVDSEGINWGATPPTPIVNAPPTAYTHVYCSFYLPSLKLVTDFAEVATNSNPAYGGIFFVEAMHKANKKVVLSVGGATELPTSPNYFIDNDPVALAHTLAKIVINASFDGVDIDYEDDYSNGNPGLTGYGPPSSRSPGGGPAIAWLCTLSTTLRALLPASQGYTISHAPQPPYFALGYTHVEQQCGDSIDWYNIQYYNQGDELYTNYTSLVVKTEFYAESSCVEPWDGSLTDLVVRQGIPEEKIVVGKIITPADGNNGWVDVTDLASIFKMALTPFPALRGAMAWQWGSDDQGIWIAQISAAFGPSPPQPPSPPRPTPPAPSPPAPTPSTPSPSAYRCNPAKGCNVCTVCCNSYISSQAACNSCVAQAC